MGAMVQAEQHAEVADGDEGQSQYLTFLLGGEMFAIPILNIKEIIEYGHLTTVPMMPAFIRGVINLRGSVVPVVDLAVRFGRKAGDVTRRTCIVIIEIESGMRSRMSAWWWIRSTRCWKFLLPRLSRPPPSVPNPCRFHSRHGQDRR